MTDNEFRERLESIREKALSKTMGDNNEESYTESLFESIRHVNEFGQEFWYARELQVALEYKEWRNFSKVVEKAKTACEGSENNVSNHFVDVNKIVNAGATHKKIGDIELSRYACYLIVQNADPRKKVVAVSHTYFAIKTHHQELIENYDTLDEDLKRLAVRNEIKEHNRFLAEAAKMAGAFQPCDHTIFQNKGY